MIFVTKHIDKFSLYQFFQIEYIPKPVFG